MSTSYQNKSFKYTRLILPLTPTNYPIYYARFIRHARQLKTAEQKQNYAHTLLSDLQQFVRETEPYHNNHLTPIIRHWLIRVQTEHSQLSLNDIIAGIRHINAQNNNLIL